MKRFGSPSITVRRADNASEAEQLLPAPILGRLCSDPNPSPARRGSVYLSRVIVAADGDGPLGFGAYKPTPGPIRVAHERWVDPHARCGLAPVIEAMLIALEQTAMAAGCSRLFVVVAQSSVPGRIFENSGYSISLAGGELTWFEKGLVEDCHPLESA